MTSLEIANGMQGIVHEVRCSKGVRYTQDYTPAATLTADKDTLALYRFDEGLGNVLRDSSGNNHHGKIVGAKWVKVENAVPGTDYALQFAEQHRVELPDHKITGNSPFTFEGFVTPGVDKNENFVNVIRLRPDIVFMLNKDNQCTFALNLNQKDGQKKLFGLNGPVLPKDKRVHFAGVRTDREIRLYLDGKLVSTVPTQGNELSDSPFLSQLGGRVPSSPAYFRGTLDEVRISNAARYDKNFTPAARHEPDKDTLALYHFDEGTGDVLRDSSGNNHHGKIVGAKWVTVEGTSQSDSNRIVVKSIPAEALTFNGHRYLLVDSEGNWDQARTNAEALGGHLATINSKEERDWIRDNIIRKRSDSNSATWIGGIGQSNTWSWVTGEPFDKSVWLGTPTDSKQGKSNLCWIRDYWNGEWPMPPSSTISSNGTRSVQRFRKQSSRRRPSAGQVLICCRWFASTSRPKAPLGNAMPRDSSSQEMATHAHRSTLRCPMNTNCKSTRFRCQGPKV